MRKRRCGGRALAFLPLLAAVACAGEPATVPDGDRAPLHVSASVVAAVGETFRLAPGQIATVADGRLFVKFAGVAEDSRCPIDALCVWPGDAEAVLRTADPGGRWTSVTLHTHLEPRAVRVDGFTIALSHIEPANRAEVRIPPADYVAVLRVTR